NSPQRTRRPQRKSFSFPASALSAFSAVHSESSARAFGDFLQLLLELRVPAQKVVVLRPKCLQVAPLAPFGPHRLAQLLDARDRLGAGAELERDDARAVVQLRLPGCGIDDRERRRGALGEGA